MKAIVITLVLFLLITGILINYLHRSMINIVETLEEFIKLYKKTIQDINKALLNFSTRIGNLEEKTKNVNSTPENKN